MKSPAEGLLNSRKKNKPNKTIFLKGKKYNFKKDKLVTMCTHSRTHLKTLLTYTFEILSVIFK